MSTIGAQIDGVRTLSRILTPHNLKRSGAVSRQSEAEHLVTMLKDVVRTLEEIDWEDRS